MADGVGDEPKKVTVDNTARLDNLYKLARRAKDENNTEKVAQYYEQILLEDPLNWEPAFYSTYYSAFQKWRNDEKGTALTSLRNSIENVITIIIENIDGKSKQVSAIEEVSRELRGICVALYDANQNDFESFYSRYKEVGYSSNNYRVFQQVLQQTSYVNIGIAEIYYTLGEKMLNVFENEGYLDGVVEELIELAVKTANRNPCDYALRGYAEAGMHEVWQIKNETSIQVEKFVELCNSGLKKVKEKQAALVKRRFIEYWDAHQSEKAELESEKNSLNGQIAELQEEIAAVPQKTEGYDVMIELQKKVDDLDSEKSALGFFKFKEKKAVQEQIDSTGVEIATIQGRIYAAQEEVRKRIPPLKKRIAAIDEELTKPR